MQIPLVGAALVIALSSVAAPARAQLAVIDVPAIVQLVQEVQALQQQVQTAESQLTQAKQALQTMTGGRGMELLLVGTVRNYLPTSWTQLSAAQQGAGADRLSADVRAAMAANAVLTQPQLQSLSAADRQLIIADRQQAALRQALVQEALVNSSARFAAVQALIDGIPRAVDQKGILDLQARIDAEVGMLQNEQTKLQILSQATLSQEVSLRLREREQIVSGHGAFGTRFRPRP